MVRRSILVCFIFSASVLPAQERESGLFHSIMERISADFRAESFMGRGDYGSLGSGTLNVSAGRLSLFSPRSFLFNGNVTVVGGVGLGSRHKKGDLSRVLDMRTYSVGIGVPLADFARLFNLDHPLVLQASPSFEKALMRNYHTGHYIGVSGFRMVLSLTAHVNEVLGFSSSISRFAGRQPRSGFVWDTVSESVGFGISLNIGRLLQSRRELQSSFSQLRETSRTAHESLREVSAERDSLAKEFSASRNALITAAVRLSGMIDSLKANSYAVRNPSPQAPSVVREQASGYDEARKAPVRVIKIDKRLFDRGNLIEEEYLKAILSIVSNHSEYVWEIAFRDFMTDDRIEGRVLAEKISQFFQIYDSRLRNRIMVTHDRDLRPEMEIRCLGMATQPITEAASR